MMHSFDPNIAKLVGVNAAVIHQNIVWWTQKNAANSKHFYDGRYWTYNSITAFDDLFPYLTKAQIRSALLKLEDAGLIVCGNYNKSAYDRTKWYSPNEQLHLSNLANGFEQDDEPIPVDKPVGKPDKDMSSDDDLTVNDVVEAWNDLAVDRGLPKVSMVTEARRRQVQARIKEYPDAGDWSKALSAIDKSKFLCGDNDRGWRANFDFLLQPSTFIKLLEGTYDR